MIRNARLIGISALVVLAVAGARVALAGPAQQAPQVSGTTVRPTSPATARPPVKVITPPNLHYIVALTSDECEGLGGVVSNDSSCKSGHTCGTSSQAGVVRYVCISVAK